MPPADSLRCRESSLFMWLQSMVLECAGCTLVNLSLDFFDGVLLGIADRRDGFCLYLVVTPGLFIPALYDPSFYRISS